VVLLNCEVKVLGPLATVQEPVPMVGAFAARVALPEAQIVWLPPALAVVGKAATVILTLDEDDAQGELLIVHVKT
jgi:hypothetical protein